MGVNRNFNRILWFLMGLYVCFFLKGILVGFQDQLKLFGFMMFHGISRCGWILTGLIP